jgi:hypothetical protein
MSKKFPLTRSGIDPAAYRILEAVSQPTAPPRATVLAHNNNNNNNFPQSQVYTIKVTNC